MTASDTVASTHGTDCLAGSVSATSTPAPVTSTTTTAATRASESVRRSRSAPSATAAASPAHGSGHDDGEPHGRNGDDGRTRQQVRADGRGHDPATSFRHEQRQGQEQDEQQPDPEGQAVGGVRREHHVERPGGPVGQHEGLAEPVDDHRGQRHAVEGALPPGVVVHRQGQQPLRPRRHRAGEVRRRAAGDRHRGGALRGGGVSALRAQRDRGRPQGVVATHDHRVGGAGAEHHRGTGGPDQVALAPQCRARAVEPGGDGGAVDVDRWALAARPGDPVRRFGQVLADQPDLLELEGHRRGPVAARGRQHRQGDGAHVLALHRQPAVGRSPHHLHRPVVEANLDEGPVARHPAPARGQDEAVDVDRLVDGDGDRR